MQPKLPILFLFFIGITLISTKVNGPIIKSLLKSPLHEYDYLKAYYFAAGAGRDGESTNTIYYSIDLTQQIQKITRKQFESLNQTSNESGPVAAASFANTLQKNGWSFLKINTNGYFTDNTQFYTAGYLEGYLTQSLIWDHYNNYFISILQNVSNLTQNAQKYVENQIQWMRNMSKTATENQDYWALVSGLLDQLQGIYDGYMKAVQDNGNVNQTLDFWHIYYLTNMGDLEDVIPAFGGPAFKFKGRECSGFVKLTEDDLFFAHNTFNIYTLMLRVYKTFTFNLSNPSVVSKTVSFSSRPGDLESKDDFYFMSSNLTVLETSLNTYNSSLYSYLHYNSIPTWLRANLANRLARNASHWASLFQAYHSGTHNNQWLVVDYNKYNSVRDQIASNQTENITDIVWMVEEFYYLMESEDLTQSLLLPQSYVASYNVPYNQEIYNISGYATGYGYTYENDPRAILFREHQANCTNIEDVKYLLRLNDNSTGSLCSAIAPRCDLIPNGYAFGAIDAKVLNKTMLDNGTVWLISGPTTENDLPAFSFTGDYSTVPHDGMPITFDFNWVFYSAYDDESYQNNENNENIVPNAGITASATTIIASL